MTLTINYGTFFPLLSIKKIQTNETVASILSACTGLVELTRALNANKRKIKWIPTKTEIQTDYVIDLSSDIEKLIENKFEFSLLLNGSQAK